MKRFLCIVLCVLTVFSVCETAVCAQKSVRWGTPKKRVNADAYMLVSLNDEVHTVVASENADKKKYPASLTKIVTAMVVLNNTKNIRKKTTVHQSALDTIAGTGAQSAGLRAGDTLTVEQLLYLAIVFSACDACQVLAQTVAGSVPQFVKMMNAWVKKIGCSHSHFVNPEGLHHENQYTTAFDMRLIALKAIENKTFLKIAQTVSYTYKGTVFAHTSKIIHSKYKAYYYPYAKGIKTGYTKQAGRCLVTIAEKKGYRYLAVLLDAPLHVKDRALYNTVYFDAKNLFEWAFGRFRLQKIRLDTYPAGTVPLKDAKRKNSLFLISREEKTVLLPIGANPQDSVIQPVKKPKAIYAPIRQGDSICEAVLNYDGVAVARTRLIAGETAELSRFSRAVRHIWEWLQGKR